MARPARLPSGIELRGDGQFRLRIRRAGLDVSETHPDLPSANAARARYLELAAAGKGNEIARAKLSRRQLSETTIGDLLRRYQTDVTPGKKGADVESGRIDVLLTLPFADATLADVTDKYATPSIMEQFVIGRLDGSWRKQVTNDTVNRELNLLSHVFSVAAKNWKYAIDGNPVSLIGRPKKSKPRTRRIADESEEKRIFAAIDEARAPYLKTFVRLAVETGMRRSELVAAEWSEVDIKRRTWHIPDSKTDNPRTVALTPGAVMVLEQWQTTSGSSTGRVFAGVTGSAATQAWRRIAKRAGAVGLRMHDLRREAVSRLFERHGLDIREVQAQAGHTPGSSQTEVYTALSAQVMAKKIWSAQAPRLALELPDELRLRLAAESERRGQEVTELVLTLLREALDSSSHDEAA